jgi:sigma-B regulation protein RsbU (phosphoserine phosphatase)
MEDVMAEAASSATSMIGDHQARRLLVERRGRLREVVDQGGGPRVGELLTEVDEALERLEGGSWGRCALCHDPIERDRLAADPTVAVCVDCLSPDQRRALERDLELARHIQGALLPDAKTRFPGWQFCFEYRPLGLVSGDYCDLIPNGDTLFFALGDISGKGVSAAMLMANLQAILRSMVALGTPLAELMDRANRLFCDSTLANSYTTLVSGTVSPSGRLDICNAGHPPPLLLLDGTLRRIPASGVPIGLFASARYEVMTFDLSPGDRLLMFSDGVIESCGPDGAEFGSRPLERIARDSAARPAADVVRSCLEEVDRFRGGCAATDDVSLMAISRTE